MIVSLFKNSYHNPNLELLNQIKLATEGLVCSSESEHPYEIFLWETAYLGEFNLEDLLKAFKHLEEIDKDKFINSGFSNLEWLEYVTYDPREDKQDNVSQSFCHILAKLSPYLSNVKLLVNVHSCRDIYVLLAQTPSNDWLGISTKGATFIKQQRNSSQLFRFQDLAVSKPENQELIKVLEDVIADVKLSSQDFEEFAWEIAQTRNAVIHNLLDTVKITTTNEVEFVLKSYSHSNSEERQKEINANNLIMSSLNNLRIYRVRDGYIYMYFMAQMNP